VEAVWMLAFPATRGSLLVLLAGLSAVVATQLFLALREEYRWYEAGLAAATLLALPLMRKFTGLTMPDLFSVVLVFGAAMAFGNFLDREKRRDALLAGALGGLAVLNGASGIEFVILFGIVWTQKLRLIRNPFFWVMSALIVAASVRAGSPVVEHSLLKSGLFYATQFGSAIGLAFVVLVVIGIIVKGCRAGDHRGRWTMAGALLIAGILGWITPGDFDARRILPALPAALMFALAGGKWVMGWIGSRPALSKMSVSARAFLAVLFAALAVTSAAGSWRKEPCTGFAPLAEALIEDSAPTDLVLVSSDPSGEERFIAELAERERRPGHFVLCGTRLLARPGKKFGADEPAFPSDSAVFEFLMAGRIKYIVLDDAVPDEKRGEHHYQLLRAIEGQSPHFWVIATAPVTRDGVVQSTPAKLYKIKRGN
jgi:hypothetical protein